MDLLNARSGCFTLRRLVRVRFMDKTQSVRLGAVKQSSEHPQKGRRETSIPVLHNLPNVSSVAGESTQRR